MVVYVEYAFAENFLIDGTLLYLAFHAAKTPLPIKKWLFSSVCGGAFALLSPLLTLPKLFTVLLNIAVGLLLCTLAFPSLKTKKDGSRYALTALLFFTFSFAFAGGVFALYGFFDPDGDTFSIQRIPAALVLLSLCIFIGICIRFIRKMYEKRALHKWIYDCFILFDGKKFPSLAFLDSGNLATKGGVPVCFASPDLIFDVFEAQGKGQVCDEITICTLGGEKTLTLYKGSIEILTDEKTLTREVYFSPSANIISREYSILLHSHILDE